MSHTVSRRSASVSTKRDLIGEIEILMAVLHFFMLVSLSCLFQLSSQQVVVDLTLVSEESGADVVRAAADRIEAVLGNDNQFLRRLAFVESADGTDADTYRPGYDGGIWQVDEDQFLDTQDTSNPDLVATYQPIADAFGIDWLSVQWPDLRIPLYSGIAARLVLLIPGIDPLPCDISGQGQFWMTNYNTNGTEAEYTAGVQELRNVESKSVAS